MKNLNIIFVTRREYSTLGGGRGQKANHISIGVKLTQFKLFEVVKYNYIKFWTCFFSFILKIGDRVFIPKGRFRTLRHIFQSVGVGLKRGRNSIFGFQYWI